MMGRRTLPFRRNWCGGDEHLTCWRMRTTNRIWPRTRLCSAILTGAGDRATPKSNGARLWHIKSPNVTRRRLSTGGGMVKRGADGRLRCACMEGVGRSMFYMACLHKNGSRHWAFLAKLNVYADT